MSREPAARDGTSAFRHRSGCVVCGADLPRAATGRRRLYCGGACRQHARRLREDARRWRAAEADADDVTRILALVLHAAARR